MRNSFQPFFSILKDENTSMPVLHQIADPEHRSDYHDGQKRQSAAEYAEVVYWLLPPFQG